MTKVNDFNIFIFLAIVFIFRLGLSLTIYNPDIHNHIAWMESVQENGWQGIYARDVSPWASVNYPPLTLYSFWLGEQAHRSLPTSLQSPEVRASLYKLPSLIADCLIAYLIWRFTPWSRRARLLPILVFLFNPALMTNSVFWGQVESLSALTAIATILALIHRRADLAVIAFALGLLTKQNILPLTPLLLAGLWLSRPPWKRLLAAILTSLGLIILAYAPLVPPGVNAIIYIPEIYLATLGGQAHQHLTSLNAFNFWHLLGLNQVSDAGVRGWGMALTGIGVVLGVLILLRYRRQPYLGYWLAAVIISLWTFTFATRMHERHSYMAIAYLTFLLPLVRWRWIYLILSIISFYNLYAVWSEYFVSAPYPSWDSHMQIISSLMVITTLATPFLIFLYQRQHQSHPNSNHQQIR